MSGLFGSTAQPSSVGSGLFGASTTSSVNSAGPFGTQNTAPAATTGAAGSSLFGGLGAAQAKPQTQQTGSGLFGATQTQQQPAAAGLSSAFGSLGQNNPATGGGLFGALGGNNAQAQQPATTSAFGASTAAPSASAAAPAFATSTNGQNTQAGGALFDTLLAKAKKQADGETTLSDLPSLQLGLGDLQQRLRKLGPRGRAGPERPLDGKAHYLLAASGVDPGAAVKDLGAFNAHAARSDRPLGATLGGEVDVDTYLSNLQNKTTMSMIADGLDRSMRDFDSFLEEHVTMEWEAQRQRIYEHFGIKMNNGSDGAANGPSKDAAGAGGFGRSRRSKNVPGTPSRATHRNSAFGRSNLLRSVIGTPSRVGAHNAQFVDVEPSKQAASGSGYVPIDDRFLKEKQRRFIDKIHVLNDSRMEKVPYPILSEFSEVTARSGDVHAPKIVEAYQAMMVVVGENPKADHRVPDSTARERQFAQSYLNSQQKSPGSLELRKQILSGASRYMEQQFLREVESAIAKAPLEANLGGRPDVVSKIRAYIRVLAAKKNLKPDGTELQMVQGEYIWAIVFYLLRTGHVNEAATYVNEHQSHFRSVDRTFSSYINSYASSEDRRLKRPMQERCSSEYLQRSRTAAENSVDPYRMACYKIVGRCDLGNRSFEGLRTDINDWIWLQFSLAREGDRSTEMASESYGLEELQKSIEEIGLKHFAPKAGSSSATSGGGGGVGAASAGEGAEDTASSGAFGMFFFLQVLAGMYEAAVAYLYGFSRMDAVHFAIALEYYGLLRHADALSVANELKSRNTRNQLQINFAPLVGLYTQDFRAADVAAAVDYIVLICLNLDASTPEANQQQAALCHEGLRALVLETREFSKLIGDIRPDGQRIRGMIEERGRLIALENEEEFLRTISLEAARAAEESGRTTDAVLLNHLAGDYDAVVGLVSRTLSEAISMELGEEMRLAPVKPRVEGASAEQQSGTSLSLASIDDPVELARTMLTMYERDNMFRRRIGEQNRVACGVLLQMSEIRALVQAERWPECLDKIRQVEILPLNAQGDPSIIRHYAANFSSLTQPVAANVPNLVMWTTVCCAAQRQRLASGQFTGNEAAARMLFDELKQMTVDLTTYTSQLRYRFPPAILEALARAVAD